MGVPTDKLKKAACEAIDKASSDLHALSKEIWDHPELLFEEKYSHDYLAKFLEKYKFKVERNYKLDTAFRSVYGGDSGPNVAVLCEYDALPEIGHACGHNLIAEAGVGASIGIKAAMDAAGKNIGKVTVLGTPAEENGGGGKIKLSLAGAFESVDTALMCHPCPTNVIAPKKLNMLPVDVTYHGKASHAAAFPWDGVNALDAAVMAYNNVSCLRQQLKPSWRVHGVITNGGAKPNIIPEKTAMQYYVRAPTMGELRSLKEKMISCFEAAAKATGCTVDIKWDDKPYENLISNRSLVKLFKKNATSIGIEETTDPKLKNGPTGSTDMGNVSHIVPSIHPMFGIGSNAVNHTRDFTAASGDDKAQPYTIAQAKALAMTAIDVYCNPEMVQVMKEQLKEDLELDSKTA